MNSDYVKNFINSFLYYLYEMCKEKEMEDDILLSLSLWKEILRNIKKYDEENHNFLDGIFDEDVEIECFIIENFIIEMIEELYEEGEGSLFETLKRSNYTICNYDIDIIKEYCQVAYLSIQEFLDENKLEEIEDELIELNNAIENVEEYIMDFYKVEKIKPKNYIPIIVSIVGGITIASLIVKKILK